MLTLNIDQIETVPEPEVAKKAALAFAQSIEAALVSLPHDKRTMEISYAQRRMLIGGKLHPSISIAVTEERAQYSANSLVEMAGEKTVPLPPTTGLWKHI